MLGEMPVDLGRDGADRLVQQDLDVRVRETRAAPRGRAQQCERGRSGRPDEVASPNHSEFFHGERGDAISRPLSSTLPLDGVQRTR